VRSLRQVYREVPVHYSDTKEDCRIKRTAYIIIDGTG
jgi:hypothetical protein